jgi:hypothetical protein
VRPKKMQDRPRQGKRHRVTCARREDPKARPARGLEMCVARSSTLTVPDRKYPPLIQQEQGRRKTARPQQGKQPPLRFPRRRQGSVPARTRASSSAAGCSSSYSIRYQKIPTRASDSASSIATLRPSSIPQTAPRLLLPSLKPRARPGYMREGPPRRRPRV